MRQGLVGIYAFFSESFSASFGPKISTQIQVCFRFERLFINTSKYSDYLDVQVNIKISFSSDLELKNCI